MSGPIDIRPLLKSWPYDPEDDMRLVRAEDGRQVLQVRTPLGIEQHELDGRPDGARPHDRDSALEYYLQKLEAAKAAGQEGDFELDERQCGELFNEGTLFYFRYVRLFQLKDWARTIRDTGRNLQVFELVRRYAKRAEDRQYLERWRPYIIRINASAGAMQELERRNYDRALKLANDAVQQLEQLEEMEDETFQFERERSLAAMRELADQIQKNRPRSELEQLEHQLHRAIERQEFERAAQLRDRIRALKQQQVC